VIGLEARGIVSELAPAQRGRRIAATLRINWHALSLDQRKLHILETRMQQTLPGVKKPADPEAAAAQNPVESVRIAHDTLDTVSSGDRTPCPVSSDTVSSEKNLGFSGSISGEPQSSVANKSQWEKLPAWLIDKIDRELDQMKEAAVGRPRSESPEAARRTILIACERAGVWPHVRERLAEESYRAALAERGQGGSA